MKTSEVSTPCFAVRWGELQDRWDVNYTFSTLQFVREYSNPKYSLTSLRELVSFVQYGISVIATEEPVGVPMLRMNNLQNDGWDLTDLKYIELPQEELDKYKIVQGDLLFNRTNSKELVGKCEVFTEPGDWVFASYLIRVRLDKTKALPDFVSNFLSTKSGRLQIDRVSRQIIGMSNVNAEELKDLLIPLPDLKTQRALVAEMESARAMRQSKLAQAESLLKGIDQFVLDELGIKLPKEEKQQVFGLKFGKMGQARIDPNFHHPDFYKLTKSLQKTNTEKLENLVEFSSEIWNPIEEKASTFFYIEISGVNIQTGEVTATEVPVDEAPSRARMIVKEGDILVSLTRPHRGAIALLDKSLENCVASTGFAVLRKITKENILREYLWAILHNPICLRQMLQRSSGGNYPAITDAELKQIFIPIPSIDIQKKIVSELQNRRAQARSLREEAERQWRDAKEKFEKALLG